MLGFFKKALFWVVLIVLVIAVVLFINTRIESNKSEKKKEEKSENNPRQNPPKLPNNDNPPDNPEPPPINTENWWLGDREIEHAYSEISKELGNSPEIQLVSPSIARVIQEGGEVSEDLKKAKIIFFPINNSENHETGDSGNHRTLLVLHKEGSVLGGYHYNSFDSSVPVNVKKVTDNFRLKLNIKEENSVVYPAKNLPQQTNNADCGVYIIAFTKRFQGGNTHNWGLKEEDLIFSITEERQKLKAAGFPKK